MSADERKNSFDIIRFVAATLVIFSHSFALVGLIEPHIGSTTLGGFSVWVFFILSGYLIAFSWKQYPRFNVFMAKRILRIFPGLIIVIIVTILFMGFLSTVPYRHYLTNSQTISYLNNIFLYNPQYSLPGVFARNIYPSAVNGSIWTLPYEFTMYGTVAILGILSLLKKRRIELIWLFLFIFNAVIILFPRIPTFTLFYLDIKLAAQLGLMFFSGVILQVYDKKIDYKNIYWLPALLLFFVCSFIAPSLTILCGGTILAFGLIGFAKKPYFSGFGKYGDFSYGMYIYAFPVQQAICYFTGTRSPYKLFGLAFVFTLILAIISWHTIESRFIKFKKRIRHKDYPLSERHDELMHAW